MFQPCQLKKGGFWIGIAALPRELKTRASRGFEGMLPRENFKKCTSKMPCIFCVLRSQSMEIPRPNYRWFMFECQKGKKWLRNHRKSAEKHTKTIGWKKKWKSLKIRENIKRKREAGNIRRKREVSGQNGRVGISGTGINYKRLSSNLYSFHVRLMSVDYILLLPLLIYFAIQY